MIRGARALAEQALTFSRLAGLVRPALVNGAVGVVAFDPGGRPFSVMGLTVRGGKIVEIDVLADGARLLHVDLAILDDSRVTASVGAEVPFHVRGHRANHVEKLPRHRE